MSKLVADQADGLRRLLSHTPTRVVAVLGIGRGDGATTTAMNLGAALVHQGKDVLLLDEHGSAAACAGDTDPRQLCHGVVLVDAKLDGEGRLSPLAESADELLLVLQPNAVSITSAYAGIKRLHYAHGLKQLRFLVNGVSGAEDAQRITTNLANTGSRYLAVSLQAAGWVSADPHMADARRLNETLVDAFPASPAAVDYRRIAADMGRWPWRAAAPQRARTVESPAHAPRPAMASARSTSAQRAAVA
jgi:flagellar biosynthesis protein FlhG